MNYLIKDLIVRLESQMKKDEKDASEMAELEVKDAMLILHGKIIGLELCVKELKRMVEYNEKGLLNK